MSGCNSGLQIYIRQLVDIRVSKSDGDGKSTSLQGSVLVGQSLQLFLLFRSSHCEGLLDSQYSDVCGQAMIGPFLDLVSAGEIGKRVDVG